MTSHPSPRRAALTALTALALCACTDHALLEQGRLSAADSAASADLADDTGGADAPDPNAPRARFPFLRVLDTSQEVFGPNPGTDLDAVGIVKPDGRVLWAAKVEDYWAANEVEPPSDVPDNALGEPQAFGQPFAPENASPDKECSLDPANFLGLGGPGGYAVLSFGEGNYIENGDTINIYEIGGCANQGSPGYVDTFMVEVALAASPDTEWITLFAQLGGLGAGPLLSVTVWNVPDVPIP